jgi:DnaK suppressor protein
MNDERARELLTDERRRIEKALARIGDAIASSGQSVHDPADLAGDVSQDEVDEAVEDHLRRQLAAVERAERRLAAGTYGRSTKSGMPIPDERLEVVPTAELTVEEEATHKEHSGMT